jgi:ethanolamine permease
MKRRSTRGAALIIAMLLAALAAAVICLATMVYFNALVAALFAGLAAVGYGYFLTTRTRRGEALAPGPLGDNA